MFSKAPVEAKTDFLCLDSVRQLLTTYTVSRSDIGSAKIFIIQHIECKNTDTDVLLLHHTICSTNMLK